MPIGVLEGGWDYVTAAYAIVWGGMLLYGLNLFWRYRAGALEVQDETKE